MKQGLVSRALSGVAICVLLAAGATAGAASPARLSGTLVSGGDVTFTSGRRAQITPNSQTVLFLADRVTDNTVELWSVPVTGGTPSRRSGTVPAGTVVENFKISPDGNWVAYLADPNVSGKLELFLAPVTGASTPVFLSQAPTLVASDVGQYDFTLNSANVMFIADRVDDGVAKNELWTVPITGGTPTKLSGNTLTNGNITSFALSLNGNTVVFRGDRVTDDRFELWATPVAGGTIINVSGSATGTQSAGGYLISPDNARVVFQGDFDAAGVVELYSAPLTGASRVKLSGNMIAAGDVLNDFLISPNSQTVVFRADKDSDFLFDIWSVPIAGTTPVKLSNAVAGSVNSNDFRLTSDGQRVVYAASVSNGFDLYSIPIGGGTATLIMPDLSGTSGVTATTPQLSPDGTRVVYAIDRETAGVRELWSVAVTGGPVVKLSPPMVSTSAVNEHRVSADSKRVVFTTAALNSTRVELWSADITGGPPTRISGETLHPDATSATLAALSADSQFAVFTMDRATTTQFELWSTRTDGGGALLDIDGDGKVLPGTDLLILMRWQLGVRGNALFAGALGAGATRNTAALIEAYLQQVDVQPAP